MRRPHDPLRSRALVISFWVGTGIVWWCAFGPHVALRSGAPLEFIAFAMWMLIHTRILATVCNCPDQHHTSDSQKRPKTRAIGFLLQRAGLSYGRTHLRDDS